MAVADGVVVVNDEERKRNEIMKKEEERCRNGIMKKKGLSRNETISLLLKIEKISE